MNKITQQEFDALPIVDGLRQCPRDTDYSGVEDFGEGCSFGERCSFGEGCSFGKGCSFGESCSFGEWCSFGKGCSFGEWCSFGEGCRFGEGCSFGKGCSFGESCSFGEGCSFGKGCSFGEWCSFGKGCIYNNHTLASGYPLLQLTGAGRDNRATQAWNTQDGIIIRCGCFDGTLDEFRAEVLKTHGENKHALVYFGFTNLAAVQFDRAEEVIK
jgi:acetyltransferase-like isoleucine patch superfamily enzyme